MFIRSHKQPVMARDSDVNFPVLSRVLCKSVTHACYSGGTHLVNYCPSTLTVQFYCARRCHFYLRPLLRQDFCCMRADLVLFNEAVCT